MNTKEFRSRGWLGTEPKNQTSTHKRRRWLGAVAALVLPFAVLTAPAAFAADGPWDIEGATIPDTSVSTAALVDDHGTAKELGPLNSSSTKIGVIHAAGDPSTTGVPVLGLTNPNGQVDLYQAWLETTRDPDTGDVWLYFAWQRDANSGSGFIAYEFMKSAPPDSCKYDGSMTNAQLIANCNPWLYRQAGDFIILWDQQGGSRDLYLREWQAVDGKLVLGAPDKLNATVSAAVYSPDGYKGEASVNLSATVFKDATGCESFANTIPSTVTGNSDTADYKDTILKQAPPVGNCGSLTVKKVIVNDNGGTATAKDFSFSFGKDGETAATYTFNASGSNTFNDLSGKYSAAETPPSGYTVTGNTCIGIEIGPGDSKTCTITNDDKPGTLTVKKVVLNDNGGTAAPDSFSFTYGLDGATATTNAAFEANGENSITVNAGTYDVTETPVAGYTMTSNTCDNVVVPNGGSATCTITNDDQPGTLIVTKIVTTDNGGTAKPEDFSFTYGLDGKTGTTVPFEADGVNSITVNAGTYDVTETPVAGYTPSYSCDNIIVPNGGTGVCTITNDDEPGKLIVKKVVVNDNGGTLEATDFSFQVNGGDATAFLQDGDDALLGKNSLTLNAGTYTVTEPAVTGYTSDVTDCAGVTVTNGGTTECTITNDDQPGTLIVKKVVTNDHGGTATPDAFSFTYGLDGQAGTQASFEADGSNSLTVNAGTYDVTETPIDGYTMTSNTCDNVVVPNGGSASCTITNDDQQGTLIVNKVVTNDNGGTATPDAFSFTYGLDGEAGTTVPFEADGSNSLTVDAGSYDATETPIAGYSMTSNTCDNVVVPNGGSASCTITNDDQQGTLIVHKQVVNDNGGTLHATDFTFEVNGGVATGFAPDGDDPLLGKNSLTVDSGHFTVTEPAVIGYTSAVSNCADVFVPSGGIGECTIVNDDQQGTLIVHKEVINDNGGTLEATDFSFQVNSGDVTAFLQDGDNALLGKNSLTVDSGYYTVTEPAVTGYTADVSNCANVFVPNGLTAECTITNEDQPGTLIVKKVVVNDNGGSMTASDFAFDYGLVGGPTTNQLFEGDGVNEITVKAGAYNVTELAAFGYTTTYDNCTGVVVPNGGSATCTITNDDQPGTLIVNKLVVNDNGDTKVATDFAFEVNGGEPVPFSQNGADILKGRNAQTVDAGTYVVTEPAVSGYAADVSDCAEVVVVNGGTSECTIVNDDSKASPTGSTTQQWVLHDSLAINQLRPGAPDAAANVTFKLFSSATCSIDSQVGADEAATLNGATATTVTGVLVESPGTYYWTVSYPGDQYNNPFTTDCGMEYTTITAANE